MSKNDTNNIPAQPVYIMQPQQQPQQNDSSIFDGLGNIALSVLTGIVLGQIGIGFPKIPKL